MDRIAPIVMVTVLGALFAAGMQRFRWPWPARAGAAAVLATVAWGVGVYVLLWATAPAELGPPLPHALVMTFLTALPPALLTSWLLTRGTGSRPAAG